MPFRLSKDAGVTNQGARNEQTFYTAGEYIVALMGGNVFENRNKNLTYKLQFKPICILEKHGDVAVFMPVEKGTLDFYMVLYQRTDTGYLPSKNWFDRLTMIEMALTGINDVEILDADDSEYLVHCEPEDDGYGGHLNAKEILSHFKEMMVGNPQKNKMGEMTYMECHVDIKNREDQTLGNGYRSEIDGYSFRPLSPKIKSLYDEFLEQHPEEHPTFNK